MLKTLYGKLALALVVLFGAIGLSYGLISHALTQRYLQEAQQSFNRDLARNLVADRGLIAGGQLDLKALKATFERYMTINPSIEIYWLDPGGAILPIPPNPRRSSANGWRWNRSALSWPASRCRSSATIRAATTSAKASR